MHISIKLFAAARDAAGADVVTVELAGDNATAASLRAALAESHPALEAVLPHSALAVNSEYAGDSTPVSPQDEIALIPPVSGG